MPGSNGKAAVAALFMEGGKHRIDLGPSREGRGALQEHQLGFEGALLFQHVEGMEQRRFRTGGIAGDGCRAPNHLGTFGYGGCSNGVIVCAHHHPAHAVAGFGGTDAAADQGHIAHRLQVFAWNALRSTAGGYQGQRAMGDCHR